MKAMLCHSIDKKELEIFAKNATNFIAETKYDGDRMLMICKNGKVQLLNRREDDVTFRYPEIKPNVKGSLYVDGEMCVFIDGISKFNEGIAHRSHLKDITKIKDYQEAYPVTYVVFDIIEKDGKDLKALPWTQRRAILESIDFGCPNIIISKYSSDIMGTWKEITKKGGEGIILKNVDSPYQEKRSRMWLKCKDVMEKNLIFTKYQTHTHGIRIETADGHAVNINGEEAKEVAKVIDKKGKADIVIRFLEETADGHYRMPSFVRLEE